MNIYQIGTSETKTEKEQKIFDLFNYYYHKEKENDKGA